jgi:hypothetical protein
MEIFEKLEGYVNSQKFRFKIKIGACRTEGPISALDNLL